jgi:hypothetical protein
LVLHLHGRGMNSLILVDKYRPRCCSPTPLGVSAMNIPVWPNSVQPLVECPKCNLEMRLFGTEAESDVRDLYTFECGSCAGLK